MSDTAREKLLAGDEVTVELLDAFEKEARSGYVKVEIRDELHPDVTLESETERTLWEHLDTAYSLLREGAVRLNLDNIRAGLAGQGITYRSDEEIIAGTNGAVSSLTDLAYDSRRARSLVYDALEELVQGTERGFAAAVEGLGS